MGEFTREMMFVLRHIPTKYYLPGCKDGDLKKMYEEMNEFGDIRLDADGEPTCLSGKPPVLPRS